MLCGDSDPVMDQAADEPCGEGGTPDQHIEIFAIFVGAFKPGKDQHAGNSSADGRKGKIDSDSQESPFASQVGEAFLDVIQKLLCMGTVILF